MTVKSSLLVAILAVFLFGLVSCFSNKDKLIGKKKVKGSNSLYVKIYQKDEFDFVTPISFELILDDSSIVVPKSFFIGSHDKLENLNNFHPFLHDSIFYLCYPYPEVYTIKALGKSTSLSREVLFELLKEHDSKLIDNLQ